MPAPRKYPDELSEQAVRRIRTSASIHYDERLIEAGATTSVSSVADSYSNAMTTTVRDRHTSRRFPRVAVYRDASGYAAVARTSTRRPGLARPLTPMIVQVG